MYDHCYISFDSKQGDQKVSVHYILYCNHQVHRDFLIILYYYNTLFTWICRLPDDGRTVWLKDVLV